MIDIPLGLRRALESGDCVLFIGAGIGGHLIDKQGNKAPNAINLAKEMAASFGIDTRGKYDLAKLAKVVELRKGRPELITFLNKRLSNLEPDEYLKWLFTLRWRAIFTTNYDRGIQRAYELIASPPQKCITISSTPEIVRYNPIFEVPIYHLHGSLFESKDQYILITEDDYVRFRLRRKCYLKY